MIKGGSVQKDGGRETKNWMLEGRSWCLSFSSDGAGVFGNRQTVFSRAEQLIGLTHTYPVAGCGAVSM